MSGWSADSGPQASQGVDGDLAAIYQGGEHFLQRAQMLSTMRSDAEKAVKALKEGKDIEWTLGKANEARKEADRQNALAKENLDVSVKKADAAVRDAQAEAKSIIDKATLAASEVSAAAEKTRADADRYTKQQKAKADEIVRDAEGRLADATTAQSQLVRDQAKVKEVEAAAKAAIDKYEAMYAKLQARLARLSSVMKEDNG